MNSPVIFGFLGVLRRRFRQAYPGVDLVTVEGRSCEAIRQVVDGSLDIAIVVCQPEIPQCHTRMLWTEPMVIALSAMHPLADGEGVAWADLLPIGAMRYCEIVHRLD